MQPQDDRAPDGRIVVPANPVVPARNVRLALKRGLRNRCPACGKGKILGGYLKVNESCPACGEDLHHHRADDFPQYITIFVVGHVLVAALLLIDDVWPDLPVGFHYAIWPTLAVVLCLWLLPVFKSALIAFQWALRMHGFEGTHDPDVTAAQDAGRDDPAVRSAA